MSVGLVIEARLYSRLCHSNAEGAKNKSSVVFQGVQGVVFILMSAMISRRRLADDWRARSPPHVFMTTEAAATD